MKGTAMNIRTDLFMDKDIDKNIIPSSSQLNNLIAHERRKGQPAFEMIDDINS